MRQSDGPDVQFLDDLGEQAVLPEQFFTGRGDLSAIEGERRLMLAVLEDAVNVFQKYATAPDRRGQNLFKEVEEWFMERDTGAVLSFEFIGEALGFDANVLRKGLRRWQGRRMARRSGIGDCEGVSVRILRRPPVPTHEPEELKKAAGA